MAHTEKEKSTAVRDLLEYSAPALDALMRKVGVLAPDLSEKDKRECIDVEYTDITEEEEEKRSRARSAA